MVRFSLQLAMVAAALGFLFPKLEEILGIGLTHEFQLVLCLPAVILGVRSWLRIPSFARAWPVVVCVLLAWAGIAYSENPADEEGLLIIIHLTIVLPVAALIVENRCWLLCAKTYVVANAVALALTIWFDYEVHGSALFFSGVRLGFLFGEDGSTRLAGPNHVGGQLAAAAVLGFILYLGQGTKPRQLRNSAVRPGKFSLGWTVFLALGCILTASRAAFIAWFAATTILLLWGIRTQESSRRSNLIALSSMLLSVLLFVVVTTDIVPWQTLQTRFAQKDQVLSFAGRTRVWNHAFEAWRSNPRYTSLGSGTGMPDEVLGRYDEFARPDEYGVWVMSTHSTYVEWGLSYGLLGVVPGICLLLSMCRRARQLDRQEGIISRQAFLLCALLLGTTAVIYRHYCWLAPGALILAMLSTPPAASPASLLSRLRSSGVPGVAANLGRVLSLAPSRRRSSELC